MDRDKKGIGAGENHDGEATGAGLKRPEKVESPGAPTRPLFIANDSGTANADARIGDLRRKHHVIAVYIVRSDDPGDRDVLLLMINAERPRSLNHEITGIIR